MKNKKNHQLPRPLRLSPFFLAFKMLRTQKGFYLGFILIYSLGFSLFLLSDNLAYSFKKDLQQKSREMLEGDIKIQSRRALTDDEQVWVDGSLPAETKTAEIWSFFSMIQSENHTKLVQVKAMSASYPLIGSFSLKENKGSAVALSPGEVWVPAEFKTLLNINIGDSLKLGEKKFIVKDQYLTSPDKALSFFSLGLKIYITLEDLPSTNLLQKGSRIFRSKLYEFSSEVNSETIKQKLEGNLKDPEIEITTASGQSSQIHLTTMGIFSFLSLTTLSAFFLAALGAGHFFYRNIQSQKKQFAQLSILGYSPLALIKIGVLQNIFLSLCSGLVALALCTVSSRLITPLIFKWFDITILFEMNFRIVTQAIFISSLTSLIFNIGAFHKLWKSHPGILIQPEPYGGLDLKSKWIPFLVQATYFYGLGFYATLSFIQSGMLMGLVIMGLIILSLAAFILYHILNKFRNIFGYGGKIILGRYKLAWDKTIMAFCMLGLAVILTEVVQSLQKIIMTELEAPSDIELPQFFLFDVQGEQFEPMQDSLKKWGAPLNGSSPMVRARLFQKNNKEVEKDLSEAMTTDEGTRQRFHNRGYNLSYRNKLSSSETLVKGKWWEGPYEETSNQLPQVSLEQKFANRLNLKIGDTLGFDVQGVPIDGIVSSFRRVRWASFQPNFFVLFQPGAIDMAPKTYISTIPKLDQEKGEHIERQLVAQYPNVTIINLQELIAKLITLYQKMGWLVLIMAGLGMLIGLIILSMLIFSMVQDSKKSTTLLITLGLAPSIILRWAFLEFFGLLLGAGLLGFTIAQLGVVFLNKYFLQLPWQFNYSGLVSLITGVLVFVGICLVYIHQGLKKGPLLNSIP